MITLKGWIFLIHITQLRSVSWAKCVSLLATLCTHISHGQSHRIGTDKIFSRGEKDFVNRNIALEQYLKATVHPEASRKSLVAGLSSVWIDRIRGL